MKKENENLIYEIVKREFESVQGASEYSFAVGAINNTLLITRKYLGRTISREYSGKDILKLIKKCDDRHPTLFSVLMDELSFANNPETDEEREARLGF